MKRFLACATPLFCQLAVCSGGGGGGGAGGGGEDATAAITQLITSLVGAGLGPFLIGLMNDLFAPYFGELAIRYSFSVIAASGAFGSVFLYLASRHLGADLERARRMKT